MIITASIISNDNDNRINLVLVEADGGYNWETSDGDDCNLGISETVEEAKNDCLAAWGAPVWSLETRW